ncbi:MAG: HPF/RaiA family ribosome-associated protein [Polyangiaceae bacterium]
MNILVRSVGLPPSSALHLYVQQRVRFALYRLLPPTADVTVRLVDVNGPKGGIDKTCRIDVQGVPAEVFHVEARDMDFYAATDAACSKLAERLRRTSQKRRESLRHRRAS